MSLLYSSLISRLKPQLNLHKGEKQEQGYSRYVESVSTFPSCISCGTELIFIIKKRHHLHISYAKSTPCSCVRGLAHILSGEVNVCSVGVLEMFQHWTLQFSARLTDKVQPSSILHYVALCLTSIVINKYTCVSCADELYTTNVNV